MGLPEMLDWGPEDDERKKNNPYGYGYIGQQGGGQVAGPLPPYAAGSDLGPGNGYYPSQYGGYGQGYPSQGRMNDYGNSQGLRPGQPGYALARYMELASSPVSNYSDKTFSHCPQEPGVPRDICLMDPPSEANPIIEPIPPSIAAAMNKARILGSRLAMSAVKAGMKPVTRWGIEEGKQYFLGDEDE